METNYKYVPLIGKILSYRTTWLFQLTDNFHPSVYLGDKKLTATDKVQMVEGRIDESLRIIRKLNFVAPSKIIPYFWYKYHDTNEFVTKV